MTKHTPGPWKVGKDGSLDIYSTVLGRNNDDGYVCVIHDSARAESNARLIAAAPDLLAAISRAVELIDSGDWSLPVGFHETELNAMRSAIRRATEGA